MIDFLKRFFFSRDVLKPNQIRILIGNVRDILNNKKKIRFYYRFLNSSLRLRQGR